MFIDGSTVTLKEFLQTVSETTQISVSPLVIDKLQSTRVYVDKAANGDSPVYGLNTGLGANLGKRIAPQDISRFQRQILEGRCTAVGQSLPNETGRAVLLYRILSAAKGHSGISPLFFKHLVSCFNQGISPNIPQYGSIGAGDLTQLAHWALELVDMPDAPPLEAKDAMVLINHVGLTIALSAAALESAKSALQMAHCALLLTYIGYDANRSVLGADVNDLKPALGQAECAEWLREHLKGTPNQPRRIQEALSIRTAHTTLGAASELLKQAIQCLEIELNSSSDSPVVLSDGTLTSSANFHTPSLALALEVTTLAIGRVASDSTQRIARFMNSELTGLPKYLSPNEGASAGFVPSQKTAAALLSHVLQNTNTTYPPAPVSDGIEDVAAMTPQAAQNLHDATQPLKLLIGLEARTALQAIHLREPKLGRKAKPIVEALSEECSLIEEDQSIGIEIEKAARILEQLSSYMFAPNQIP